MDPNTVIKDPEWKVSSERRAKGRENQAARKAEAEAKKAEAVAEAEVQRRWRTEQNEAMEAEATSQIEAAAQAGILRAMAEDEEERRHFGRISKASEAAAAAKKVEDDVKEIKAYLRQVLDEGTQIKEHFLEIKDHVNKIEENIKNLRQDVQEQKLLMRAMYEIIECKLGQTTQMSTILESSMERDVEEDDENKMNKYQPSSSKLCGTSTPDPNNVPAQRTSATEAWLASDAKKPECPDTP